ncbi:hypothetical protein ANCDUO_18791 [Ancylostoma duodenale]|uniref:Uncharacterized protein n=1 Tax=Ancylostoma duodenale TaxID=51022 RepID=A0A0C2FRC4_9BILA|nr:hypothetical protein ANCDUO_18791 [Ancylostoma duodenale]
MGGQDGANEAAVGASEPPSRSQGLVRVREQLERVICKVEQVPHLVNENLAGARIAGKYRSQMNAVIEEQVKTACDLLNELKKNTEGYKQLGKELFRALDLKGIESMDDFNDFLSTTERDAELVTDICDMFDTDVLQIRDVLGEIQLLQSNGTRRSPANHR